MAPTARRSSSSSLVFASTTSSISHAWAAFVLICTITLCTLVAPIAVNCDSLQNHSLHNLNTSANYQADELTAIKIKLQPGGGGGGNNDNNGVDGDQIVTTRYASKTNLTSVLNGGQYKPITILSHRQNSSTLSARASPEPEASTLPQQQRLKRASSHGRYLKSLGRVPLAQRPKTSRTTTTTTTTTTSTTPPSTMTFEPERAAEELAATAAATTTDAKKADEEEEGSSDSDDYEEIEPSKSKSKIKASRGDKKSTPARANSGNAEEEGEEGEEGAAAGEEERDEVTTSMTATTTTQRTTTGRKVDKSGSGGTRKGAVSKSKEKGSQKSSSSGAAGAGAGGRAETEQIKSSSKQSVKVPAKPLPKEASSDVNDDNDEGNRDEDEKSSDEPEERAKEREELSGKGQLNETRPESTTMAAANTNGHTKKKRPIMALPFIKQKNSSSCTSEAYLEFPRDLIGDKWRSRGLILIHVFVICYMFYSLALVCERYFMPSLEEFAQRLQISEDVAGATLMSAGSSAPELFTAILGVFVAKGDVGTGAIVGSAVFNILFVIGICAFVSTTTAQLQWWPVLRDSVYYTFTVLVLIIIIYDERITALESATMIALYGVYITIMVHNETLKELVTRFLLSHPLTAKLISSSSITVEGPDDVFGNSLSSTSGSGGVGGSFFKKKNNITSSMATTVMMDDKTVEDDSIYMAACLVIVNHKRLFRSQLRFQCAARYIIVKHQHRIKQQQQQQAQLKSQQQQLQQQTEEVNYFGPESEPLSYSSSQRAKMEVYARNASLSKNKFSIVSKDDYEFWHRPPEEGENYYLWLAKIPVNYMLHYTIPDCTLYPDKYVLSFVMSIAWTAFFSYIMVWMVTIIGYTLGIPDSVMGVTFLAAGTSVPDCYSSIHAARNGMADMAVSNSIGSNVFDILIGLAVPWFIQSAIYPGVVATINSRGVIYSVILLFLSLIVTIYLMNKCDWNLQPRLGLALIIAYAVFIILTCMLEFNLFGHVNPPACPPVAGGENY